VRKADNLPPSCADVTKSGGLNLLEPCGPVQACNGTAFNKKEGHLLQQNLMFIPILHAKVFQNLAVLNKTLTANFTFVRNKTHIVNFGRSVEEAVYHLTIRELRVLVVTETSLPFKKRNSQYFTQKLCIDTTFMYLAYK
jgi:hypothetical protein